MNMHTTPYLHDRWEDEVAYEQEMLSLGKQRVQDRINKARTKGDMSNLRPYRSLIHDWIVPVSEYLTEWCKQQSSKRGVKPVALPLLQDANPDTAAVCTIRVVLRRLGVENRGIIGLAHEIGTWLEHEARAEAWIENEEKSWKSLEYGYKERGANAAHIRRSRISVFNRHIAERINWENWTDEQRRRVGLQMIDCLIQATKRFSIVSDPSFVPQKDGKGKYKALSAPMILVADEELTRWLASAMDDELVHAPAYLPTLIPPKPWSGPRDGGYWTPFVRAPFLIRFKADSEPVRQGALEEWEALDMPEVYEAINAVQETPWKINTRVFEIAQKVWDMDLAIAGFPRKKLEDVPDRPQEADIDKDVRKKWANDAGEVHSRNAKSVSKFLSMRRTMVLAERLAKEPEFYFPHMLDFRGRMYPIPSELSPQGDDLHRGLLIFRDGKKVEPEDACWLAIHLANVFGVDKVSLDERIRWVEERRDLWFRIDEEPMVYREWSEADDGDSAWQALAAIFEWVAYLKDPENHVSALPIRVDGTCNGIQHLSAMVRDEDGGASVNLIPGEAPRDIYLEVADILTKALQEIVACGGPDSEKALVWLDVVGGRCPRDLTKRCVMIVPYGGTRHAYLKYIDTWLTKKDPAYIRISKDERYSMVGFLAKHMWEAVKARTEKAKEVMKWLQDNSDKASEVGVPLRWKTPVGFLVRQFYGTREKRQVKTNIDGQTYQLTIWDTTNELDKKAQARGIAPNFVHSIDAACLMRTIIIAKDYGISSVTTIHDSYGTVAADMWRLYGCIRQAFIEIHQEPLLEQFQEHCKTVNPIAKGWPRSLPHGQLDIQQIKESDYFFA